jgi:hypothetical protein
MAHIVRENPDAPAELRITPREGPPLRFSLTLAALALLNQEAAAEVGEAVRRAVIRSASAPSA